MSADEILLLAVYPFDTLQSCVQEGFDLYAAMSGFFDPKTTWSSVLQPLGAFLLSFLKARAMHESFKSMSVANAVHATQK